MSDCQINKLTKEVKIIVYNVIKVELESQKIFLLSVGD